MRRYRRLALELACWLSLFVAVWFLLADARAHDTPETPTELHVEVP